MLTLNFLIAIFLQCLFIYSVPFIIVAQNGVFKAIGKGILLFFKNFWITFIIVVLPFLFYIPIIILQDNTTKIIEKMFPEFVLYICIIGTLVNALIVDLFMTVASTYLYLKYTKNQ
ncbi:MAG: hypothetical protein N2606_00260 [Candidatus Omnitrophica bacterium]|nr:hypothetical protein [Candidatus Omnitrophota bacterium]